MLPIDLRKKFQVQGGDKLIVVGINGPGLVILLKAEVFNKFLENMDAMREFMQEIQQLQTNSTDSENIDSESTDSESIDSE